MQERLIDDPRITQFGRLVEAQAFLQDALDREMRREVGIPLLWYAVLLHIGRSPNGMRPMNELREATAFTSGGVTRLVDRLTTAGLVERKPCFTDRRVQWIALTDRGGAVLEEATSVHIRGIQEHMIDRLSSGEADALAELLAKVTPPSKRTPVCEPQDDGDGSPEL